MSEQPAQIDSRIEIVTPENIEFKYQVAGPFRRLPAYLIDLLIRVGVILVCTYIAATMFHFASLLGWAMFGYVVFFLDWFYAPVFEVYWNGQTPGKRAMGLRVVSQNGQPIDAKQAVLRNVLRVVDSLPVMLYQLGLIATACNKRFQRLGDLAAGTIVIVEESPRLYGVAKVSEPEAIRLADLIPVNFEPSRSLARALSLYVERRGGFAWGRRAEIARHLGEVLRVKFNLPPQTSHDLLLCAVYYRTFIADRAGEQGRAARNQPPRVIPPPLTAAQIRATDVRQLLDQMA